ncbi:hypothetical protein [Streptosporangium sp. NPDC006007]|uniref:hypothetical protein n=1 Tax=Streptosporangium sp. NPDC006007 TaxID=3154575 RepID=UPI0033BF595A
MDDTFYHWGCVIVPPGYADPVRFQTGDLHGAGRPPENGEGPPGEVRPAAVGLQAIRVVQVTQALLRGRLP